ncbi:MAG: hypothetical protein CTY36_00135 [Methylocystis sp.]|nr:MAG: hypothetical protein CTY36_00135 [Methylocystis sp.]
MKLAKDFECCPLGEIYPRILAAGEECPPELEASARALGLLAEEGGDAPNAGESGEQTDPSGAGNEGATGEPTSEGEASGAPRIVLPPRRPR